MSAFQRLFGRGEKFFQLLENGAGEARTGAIVLAKLLLHLDGEETQEVMADLAQSRRKHKRIRQEVTELLTKKIVTPLEREDIEELSSALYKISKNVEKIGERLSICPPGANMATAGRQVEILEQSTGVVVKMVSDLRAGCHGDRIREDYERLQVLEGEADRLMNELLRELYWTEAEARMVVFSKDIFELLEKSIDRCRDAGFVVFHVVLKNS